MKFQASDATTSCCHRRKTHFRKLSRFFLPFLGLAATIWVLFRIIPKPSRATYPCMKAAAPLAMTFIAYIVGGLISVFSFKKARLSFQNKQYRWAVLFVLLLAVSGGWMAIHSSGPSYASNGATTLFVDPLGPNQPIGEAKGIHPGRVVWIYDPAATNENCTNRDDKDAYFLNKNTHQDVVDQMFSKGLLELTGATTHALAWDAVFKYFNKNHGKGEVGYSQEETIFIKINAVTAYSGVGQDGGASGEVPVEYDTSPQSIMAILRQLVNEAGVPQQNIFVGDPIADIWYILYDYFYAEFPNIKYVSKRNVTGRTKLTASSEVGIYYSDRGAVMDEVTTHKFFTAMMEADYLINIPSMKGHRWAGVTFFAKNHFGSNTTSGSWQLHKGLMKPDDDPLRSGYRLYRVLVDIMGDQYLGGNTLLYFMDGLWSTSYEHQKPQKFQSAPFNNDWCSSLLFSLDPVAIESVCLDILQKEFKEEDLSVDPPRHVYVQFDGIDDYLHQAASSDWWPEGILYDPDNTGTPIPSLGVHEHWDNEDDMQYSKNLGTGDGIELVKMFQTSRVQNPPGRIDRYTLSENYPNPFNPETRLRVELDESAFITLGIYNVRGQAVRTLVDVEQPAGTHQFTWNGRDAHGQEAPSGVYVYRFHIRGKGWEDLKSGEMVLMR